MRRSILVLLVVGVVLCALAATGGPVKAHQAASEEMLGVPELLITKTDTLFTDLNGDGLASPGDTLRYEIIINNTSDVAATDVIFSDTPDTNTTLVAGSVDTSQGTVTSGNDGNPPVTVDIGTIPALGIVTIHFRVIINSPLPANVSQVANQGTVTGSNFPPQSTDDPDAPGDSDPTITPVSRPPIPVGGHLSPVDRGAVLRATVSPWIVPSLGLAGIIGVAGLALTRRRRTR